MKADLLHQRELTDELIEEARRLEGLRLRIEQWNHEATLDTIRHWCWGVGDTNPLYVDESYAGSGTFGGIVAPPSWLGTVYNGAIGLGLPGIQPFGAGSAWEYLEPIRRGDRIEVDARVGPIRLAEGRTAGRFIVQTTLNTYRRADGTIVARSEGRTLRIARGRARNGLSYEERAPHAYSAEELEAIRIEAISEPRRGAETRWWDTVNDGDSVPAVVKGPIDQTSMVAYYCGNPGTPRYKSVELAWLYRTWATEAPDRLPNNFDASYYAETTSPSAGHLRGDVAREVGMPGAYNNGTQTTGWLMHAVTNWAGDEGFVTRFDVKLRRPVVFGDTVWCRGTVSALTGPDLVTLSLVATDQNDELKAEATATVRLPTRPAP